MILNAILSLGCISLGFFICWKFFTPLVAEDATLNHAIQIRQGVAGPVIYRMTIRQLRENATMRNEQIEPEASTVIMTRDLRLTDQVSGKA